MNEWKLVDESTGNTKYFDSKEDAQAHKDDLESLVDGPLTIEKTNTESDSPTDDIDAEVVDHTETQETESAPAQEPQIDTTEAEVVESPEQLAKDPIAWLEGQNNDFVNTIKGTPAISKQGFRFIQSKFGITTESEVVETFADPVGIVVWAKAKLPDGQSAEAHGEGYLNEQKVDDNEFVRYADTRAKNRAISDLTSAGALAVSELTDE